LGLSATTARGLVGLLASAERRRFATMTVQAPDLVLRLNVSLNVAAARKPDHRLAALARKVADLPRLRFGGAPIVDLDADMPFDQVLARAQAAIEALLARIEGDTNPSSVAA
jgi:hypothetical protein